MSAATEPRHLTSARITNFYYSFVFLRGEKRRAIEAVYAFARRGDDVADGDLTGEEARRRMLRYREVLDDCYAGWGTKLRPYPELAALARAIERFKIPRRHFEDLILGFEMDLSARRYRTFEELAEYCYRVASTIGLIAIEIFGYRNPGARDYAVNLGTGLQLVNILRDLRADARRGRVYLPLEDLERFGVRPGELAEGPMRDAVRELVKFEAVRARDYFARARQALPAEDRRTLIAAEIMAAIYWRILGRIERRGYNVFGERVRLSQPRKFWIALSVYLGAEWQK